MILKILKSRNRLTNDAWLASQYIKRKVEDYLSELKKHNPTYFLDLHRNCKIEVADKHIADRLSFEIQELAEDLTGVIFHEEKELKRNYEILNKKNKNNAIEFYIILHNLIQREIKNQLFHKEELLFEVIPTNKKKLTTVISILSNLKKDRK